MNKEKKQNTKSAYIEQILMWMVIFIGFVWMFFFVIDYATAVRLRENIDAISKYAARYVAKYTDPVVNQSTVAFDAQFITNLNNIRNSNISSISAGDINCSIATVAPQNTNSQSIFIVQGTYLKGFLSNQGTNNFTSRTVVYNETNVAQITCTLSVTIN